MTKMKTLAFAARCIDDDDWGSERQIEAENAFFSHIKTLLTPKQFEQLEAYCLKATTDEMIDEALRLAANGK